MMKPRPQPGTVTERELKIKICSHCGYIVEDTGLCNYDCDLDGEPRGNADFFYAIYKRTDIFLRDELPNTANGNSQERSSAPPEANQQE